MFQRSDSAKISPTIHQPCPRRRAVSLSSPSSSPPSCRSYLHRCNGGSMTPNLMTIGSPDLSSVIRTCGMKPRGFVRLFLKGSPTTASSTTATWACSSTTSPKRAEPSAGPTLLHAMFHSIESSFSTPRGPRLERRSTAISLTRISHPRSSKCSKTGVPTASTTWLRPKESRCASRGATTKPVSTRSFRFWVERTTARWAGITTGPTPTARSLAKPWNPSHEASTAFFW